MPITFPVDDVTPAAAPRPSGSLADRIGPHLALGAPDSPVIETPDTHPLLAAVHVAFAEHRPLVLSPDAVWLTIAQGVALHVRLHAEELRPRLVRHSGRERLTMESRGVPSSAQDWAEVVGGFRALLADLIGEGRARLLTCNFSTTTAAAAVASEIVLMDVYAPYCAYEVACICGIPEITLLGTPEDWRAIRQRIEVIEELDLRWWTSSLAPITDQLVATAEGQPDTAFWRDIYKPRVAYGWDRVTGWTARLYPYTGKAGRFEERNPVLAFPLGALPEADAGSPWYEGPGVVAEDVPPGTSQVLVHLLDRGAGSGDSDVILEGGLLGVAQDDAGRLEPVAGWIARPPTTSMAATLERLRAEGHEIEAVRPSRWPPMGPVEIVTLFREVHAVTLFAGPAAWRLRPIDEHERIAVPLPNGRSLDASRILDLPDGTCVATVPGLSDARYVRLRVAEFDTSEGARRPQTPTEGERAKTPDEIVADDPGGRRRPSTQPASDVAVLEGTLTTILARALDSGGQLDLPTTGQSLLELAPAWMLEPPPTKEQIRARRAAAQAEREAEREERRRKKRERQAELRARLSGPAPAPEQDREDGDEPS